MWLVMRGPCCWQDVWLNESSGRTRLDVGRTCRLPESAADVDSHCVSGKPSVSTGAIGRGGCRFEVYQAVRWCFRRFGSPSATTPLPSCEPGCREQGRRAGRTTSSRRPAYRGRRLDTFFNEWLFATSLQARLPT